MPRYSILLPTRNGASLLENCLRSILDQSYEDFELVVSDNASTDDTAAILDRYGADPRLTRIKQDELVDVTENWNRALARSSGDRISLIGDDDVLLPGYFERLDRLVEQHGDPDVLLHNASAFAFPGFANSATSAYAPTFYTPLPPLPSSGPMSAAQLRFIVDELFSFDFPIPLNMQTAVVKRSAAEHLPGGLFKPPFPDFYALAGLMLSDVSWAISPERLTVIGVSPKSFGRTVHSSTSGQSAKSYLGVASSFDRQLPGSEVMNGHYETLQLLKADFPGALDGTEISRVDYVWQQAYSWYVQRRLGSLQNRDVLERARLLDRADWAGLARLLARRLRPAKVLKSVRMGDRAMATLWPGMRPLPGVEDLGSFVAWVEAHHPRP